MKTETKTFLRQAVIVTLMFCIFATPSAMVLLTSRALAKDAPPQSNSTSSNIAITVEGPRTTNYPPCLSDGRYFTQSGIEFWDDFEITNEWHTIATQGTNDYQAAVVYSNYFVKIIFEDRTNKVQLSSTLLPLKKVPMRIIETPIKYLSVTNYIDPRFWNGNYIKPL